MLGQYQLRERHALAFINFCYMVAMLDPRAQVTGAVAYMRDNYGEWFLYTLAAYFGLSVVLLLHRKVKPLEMAILAIPQWAYTCIGLWLLFKSPTAPLATFFIHFALFGMTAYLIHTRIRGIVEGSLDDTLPTSTS
jgi:hypothetical protein